MSFVLTHEITAYKTFGDSSHPAILYPSWYSGSISDNEWLIGEDKTLNPTKYFIIITALFGNGQSISPSNSKIAPFPNITFYDNVRAQHQLLTEGLGVQHLRAVTGWSMGAAQSFQWATQYPDFMDISVPFCGSARTAIHNQVFLEGQKSALLSAKHISSAGSSRGRVEQKGSEVRTWSEDERTVGLKAFGRGYAGWVSNEPCFAMNHFFDTRLPLSKWILTCCRDFPKAFIGKDCMRRTTVPRT